MSDAIVSGMFLRFLLRQSAVLSPNIVATEQWVGEAWPASDDRHSVTKHVVQIYDVHAITHAVNIHCVPSTEYVKQRTHSIRTCSK